MFFIASLLALYFGGALDLRFDDTVLWEFDPTSEQFSRIALANALLAVFVLMPFAARARRMRQTCGRASGASPSAWLWEQQSPSLCACRCC